MTSSDYDCARSDERHAYRCTRDFDRLILVQHFVGARDKLGHPRIYPLAEIKPS